MKAGTRIARAAILSTVLLSLIGCMPGIHRGAAGPVSITDASLNLPAEAMNLKIEQLETLLTDRRLHKQDRDIARRLLADYRKLRRLSQDKVSDRASQRMIQTMFTDLGLIVDRYLFADQADRGRQQAVASELVVRRHAIRADYVSGDYQGVIAECSELEASFGLDALAPDLGLLLALSLAEQNRRAEAIAAGERAIRELEGKPGLMALRASLVRWHLESGDRERALLLYEKLIDDLGSRQALLSSAKRQITLEENTSEHPGEETGESAPPGQEELLEEATAADRILQEVARLVEEDRFDDARLLLQRRVLLAGDPQEKELLEQALKTVASAEERYLSGPDSENDPIEQAMELIEDDRHDEALRILEQDDVVRGADPEETERLKNLAVEKLIQQERDRAAQTFLEARGAADPARREQLLEQSYDILKALIEAYPSTPLIDRLNGYLLRVEEELDKLQ